ncbi:MAG: hypothetical protein KY464_00480 [Gemmatimonadetes bacterium]|nr:hypothetical protein [Gemmatimonadota bacterium]
MDQDLAPMIVMVTAILTTGGVLILRPVAKHLAEYLRSLTEQSRLGAGGAVAENAQLRELLSTVESRLALLEERQNFTENLLSARREPPPLAPERKRLPVEI